MFPTLVPVTRSIAHVNNEMNMVSMSDDLVENITVVGPGAGGNATAHSVVSDVLELITNQPTQHCFGTSLIDFNRVEIQPVYSKFYVRIDAIDQNGIIENVGSVCKLYDIGINEILQTKSYDENIAFVLTTHSTTYNKIKELKKTLVGFHWCAKTPYIMMISD